MCGCFCIRRTKRVKTCRKHNILLRVTITFPSTTQQPAATTTAHFNNKVLLAATPCDVTIERSVTTSRTRATDHYIKWNKRSCSGGWRGGLGKNNWDVNDVVNKHVCVVWFALYSKYIQHGTRKKL